jgi:hypothetical protein
MRPPLNISDAWSIAIRSMTKPRIQSIAAHRVFIGAGRVVGLPLGCCFRAATRRRRQNRRLGLCSFHRRNLAEMAQHARWARFADGADEVHQWRVAM